MKVLEIYIGKKSKLKKAVVCKVQDGKDRDFKMDKRIEQDGETECIRFDVVGVKPLIFYADKEV